MGSLIDDASAWRYFIAGCTRARFCMPHQTPTLLTSLGFCQWYKVSNTRPSYKVNSTGISLIVVPLKRKVEAQRQGKCNREPGLKKLLADVASEALVAASPLLCEVGSKPAQEITASPHPGEVDSEPA